MGLHNEPGVELLDPTPNPTDTIREMLDLIFDDSEERSFVKFLPKSKVILFVNNLGGMSVLEMGGVVSETVEILSKWNASVYKTSASQLLN